MVTSRSIEDLAPHVRIKALLHVQRCKDAGIELLIYCTYRDDAAQAALYAQGRTAKGSIVTNARPGESWHNWRAAYDCVPLRGGKPVWGQTTDADRALWANVGRLGEEVGLQWSGRWAGSLKETAHFQDTQGLALEKIKAQGGFK